MTITKQKYGEWLVQDVVNGYLVSRQYYGYTKREAIREFKQDVKTGVIK